jgi:ATP-dependent helicase/nuclease subunit B
MEIAREVIAGYDSHPRVAAFWVPRFQRFAHWFAETEPARRRGTARVVAEVQGKLAISAPAGPFTLSARADRIDVTDAGLVITDYKTGAVPSDAKIAQGIFPQLPLEAAIALGEAGFTGVSGQAITGLRYIRATGGEPPGEQSEVKNNGIAALAAEALAKLSALIARFDDAATPYKALRRARFDYKFDEYAHLARVNEWAVASDDEEQLQ